jgi:putative Mn2+ efflux pump MntP
MKMMSYLVTAFALAIDACASGLISKARAKPVTQLMQN